MSQLTASDSWAAPVAERPGNLVPWCEEPQLATELDRVTYLQGTAHDAWHEEMYRRQCHAVNGPATLDYAERLAELNRYRPTPKPANYAPIPALDGARRHQEFIVGTMPYSVSVLPENPEQPCCCLFSLCAKPTVKFDLTAGVGGPLIGSGVVENDKVTVIANGQVVKGKFVSTLPLIVGEAKEGVLWDTHEESMNMHVDGCCWRAVHLGMLCGPYGAIFCLPCLVCVGCCWPKQHRRGLFGHDGHNALHNPYTEIRYHAGSISTQRPPPPPRPCFPCFEHGGCCSCNQNPFYSGVYSERPIEYEQLEALAIGAHGTALRAASMRHRTAELDGFIDVRVRSKATGWLCCSKNELVDGKRVDTGCPPHERASIDLSFRGSFDANNATESDQKIMLGFGVFAAVRGSRTFATERSLHGFTAFTQRSYRGFVATSYGITPQMIGDYPAQGLVATPSGAMSDPFSHELTPMQ